MKWLRWLRDEYRTLRTLSAVAERECRHDDTEPRCMACTQDAAGW